MKKFELVIASGGLTAARGIKSYRESGGSGQIALVDLHPRPLPGAKRSVLCLLRWNSYGTERAQPVAKVWLARSPKMV
jgi:hypothetical protein